MNKLFRRMLSLLVVLIICFGLFVSKSPSAKAIKNFTVEVSPATIGEIAEYKFRFSLEKKIEVHEWFGISFPKGTVLTPPIPDTDHERKERLKTIIDSIHFGIPCTASKGMPIIQFEVDGSMTIKFGTHMDFDPSKEEFKTMTIEISKDAGITNPNISGIYNYKMMNQQEPTYIDSQPITIQNQGTIIIQLTIGSMEATVNGEPKTLPLAPFIQKGYTLVPFRFIGESLNATVDFTTDPNTKQVKTVTYVLDDIEIVLTIGYLRAMVNGNAVLLDVPPQIKNGTTVVPLRFVSSNLGCKIDWDPVQLKIMLTYAKKQNNGDTVAILESFTSIWVFQEIWYAWARNEVNKEMGPNRVAFITYYVDSTDDHPSPRLSCQESENRMKWYMKDKGIVTMFFNGTNYIKGIPNLEDDSSKTTREVLKNALEKKIQQVNHLTSPIKLSASCTLVENTTYNIKLEVQRIGEIPFNNLQLVTALTESNIPYISINGEKIHHFVFREFLKPKEIKDTIGIPITLLKPGDKYSTEFTFELNTELYKNELNLIFFVQDMTQKTILQGKILTVEK